MDKMNEKEPLENLERVLLAGVDTGPWKNWRT